MTTEQSDSPTPRVPEAENRVSESFRESADGLDDLGLLNKFRSIKDKKERTQRRIEDLEKTVGKYDNQLDYLQDIINRRHEEGAGIRVVDRDGGGGDTDN